MGFRGRTMISSRNQGETSQQLVPTEERRRSQRVMIRIPVTLRYNVQNQLTSIPAHTVVVNDHGALLFSSRPFPAGARLEVENRHTRQRQSCRVMRAAQETTDGFLVPVEFDTATKGFWQIFFPPTNWKPTGD